MWIDYSTNRLVVAYGDRDKSLPNGGGTATSCRSVCQARYRSLLGRQTTNKHQNRLNSYPVCSRVTAIRQALSFTTHWARELKHFAGNVHLASRFYRRVRGLVHVLVPSFSVHDPPPPPQAICKASCFCSISKRWTTLRADGRAFGLRCHMSCMI